MSFFVGDAGSALRKRYWTGTHRTLEPEETLRRASLHFGLFGITRLAVVTGLDRIGVPVALAIRPAARWTAVSAGRGLEPGAAKAAAAMQAIEAAHAEEIPHPLLFGSPGEIAARHPVADIDLLLRGEPRSGRFLWIEAEDLRNGSAAWLPYALVHAHNTRPALPNSDYFRSTRNGLASGNTHAEAICQALCEVIERDACSLWSLMPGNERDARRLALATVRDAAVEDLMTRLAAAGFLVAVWDVTSDIGVPAFFCAIADDIIVSGPPGTGSACHPDRAVALAGAILEAVQERAVALAGMRDTDRRRDYVSRYLDGFRRTFERDASRALRGRDFDSIPTSAATTIEQDVLGILANLERAGLRSALAIDLTRPEVGVPVVRVVVPGLEDLLEGGGGFAPGARALRMTRP